jgi:hypothetical protein
VAGLATMLLVCVASPPVAGPALAGLAAWLQRGLVAHALVVLAEIYAIHQAEDASAAARWARTGPRRAVLMGGVLAAGAAAPAALLFVPNAPALTAAALLALGGLALWEHLYVRAGQSVALS